MGRMLTHTYPLLYFAWAGQRHCQWYTYIHHTALLMMGMYYIYQNTLIVWKANDVRDNGTWGGVLIEQYSLPYY